MTLPSVVAEAEMHWFTLVVVNIFRLWDFKFSRRRVWSSELSSGMYRDDGGSTYLWNVGRQLFYTAVHPRRQFWTLCWHYLNFLFLVALIHFVN